jgi:hypothetical protein
VRPASRRAVLRGAGGAVLGLPLLEITGGRAFAQARAPKKFLLVSVGHSVDVRRGSESWLPRASSFAQLSPIMQPLVPQQQRLLVLGGIDNLLNSTALVPSNGHNFSSRSLLTCMPTRESLDGSGKLLGQRPQCQIASAAGGPSIEFAVAAGWKENVLNLRVGERPAEHNRSYRLDGTLDEGLASPVAAFSRVFQVNKAPIGAAPSTDAGRLEARRKSILDAVRTNFARAMVRMGADDRIRLQRHADQVRELELNLDQVSHISCASPKLNPPRPLPAQFEQGEGRADDAIAGAQIDLAATALSCQATRVAHLHFSNIQNNTFPWLAGGKDFVVGGWHSVVHIDSGTDDQRLRAMQWYMSVFGDLLNRLAATPDGPGTLLDSTLVLFVSSLRANNHGTDDLPVIVAGNLGGQIKTGRLISYKNRTTGDLYTTVLNTLDIPAASFGWKGNASSGRPFQSGPLPGWAG